VRSMIYFIQKQEGPDVACFYEKSIPADTGCAMFGYIPIGTPCRLWCCIGTPRIETAVGFYSKQNK
jgi:hypothetical protein